MVEILNLHNFCLCIKIDLLLLRRNHSCFYAICYLLTIMKLYCSNYVLVIVVFQHSCSNMQMEKKKKKVMILPFNSLLIVILISNTPL